jgi:hypothetical protein
MEVNDAAKMRQVMSTLLGMASMMLQAQGMQLKTEEFQGVEIKSVDIMGMAAPCVAVSETHLLIAGSAVTAKKAIALLSGVNPTPLVGTPEFDGLVAKVGGLDGPQLIYQDPRKSMASGLETLQGVLAMMSGRERRDIEEFIDLSKIPSAQVMSKHLFGQLDVVHVDDDGLLFVGYGPLGGWAGPVLLGSTAAGVMAPIAWLTVRAVEEMPEPVRKPVDVEGLDEMF